MHNIVLTGEQPLVSWIYEKFQNLFKKQDDEASKKDIDDVMKNLSVCAYSFPSIFLYFFLYELLMIYKMNKDSQPVPTTNANGTNVCETRFAIVNYCQQYMVNTTTTGE